MIRPRWWCRHPEHRQVLVKAHAWRGSTVSSVNVRCDACRRIIVVYRPRDQAAYHRLV